jgi:hypothetical protein
MHCLESSIKYINFSYEDVKASQVFSINIATVKGPIPPGTGVIMLAIFFVLS